MELTPVRIRGKKRKPTQGSNLQSLQNSSATQKRPRQKSTKVRQRIKPAIAAMPTLQGLPQELLEIIFLHSMNINLPRTSPDLGRKLSSKAICLSFVMESFFSTIDHRAPYKDRVCTGSSSLQSDLLACRFFTYPFFLSYVTKAHSTLLAQRGRAWSHVAVPDVSFFDNLWPFKFTQVNYLGFGEGFMIPEKLLHGPWDQDKASLLYVLVSFNGQLDWANTMAGETAIDGLKEAIREGNERAVAALSVLVGNAKAITTETLRYAVIQCEAPMPITRNLLFNAQILYSETPRSTLNFHDPLLWAWADSHPEPGTLLKTMLKEADTFSLRFYRSRKDDWKNIVPFPYSGSKFDTWATFDTINREILMWLYRSYGRRIAPRVPRRRASATPQVSET